MDKIAAYIDDLYRETTKLVDLAEEVGKHYRDDNKDAIAVALGLAHYNIGHVSEGVSSILQVLRDEGITPSEALDRMSKNYEG